MNMRYPGQNWSLTFDIKVDRGLGDLSFVDDGIGARAIALFNQRLIEHSRRRPAGI